MNLIRYPIAAVLTFAVVFALWVPAAQADPPPKIDWSQLQDLLQEDPEIAVGEEMC